MVWAIIGAVAASLIVSSAIFYFLLLEEKVNQKKKLEQNVRIEELERKLNEKDRENESNLAKLKTEFSEREKDFNAQVSALKDDLQLVRDALKKEELNKGELEKQAQELQAKLEKSNKDLSSTTQMYQGLKAQYNELESVVQKLKEGQANKPSTSTTRDPANQLKEKYKNLLRPED